MRQPNKKEETIKERQARQKDDFIVAFNNAVCNISIACANIGIGRNTFYRWKKEDPDFSQRVQDEEDSMKDLAETMLYSAIQKGKTAELIFFLKTRCADRGYVEKQHHTIKNADPYKDKSVEELEAELKALRGED